MSNILIINTEYPKDGCIKINKSSNKSVLNLIIDNIILIILINIVTTIEIEILRLLSFGNVSE